MYVHSACSKMTWKLETVPVVSLKGGLASENFDTVCAFDCSILTFSNSEKSSPGVVAQCLFAIGCETMEGHVPSTALLCSVWETKLAQVPTEQLKRLFRRFIQLHVGYFGSSLDLVPPKHKLSNRTRHLVQRCDRAADPCQQVNEAIPPSDSALVQSKGQSEEDLAYRCQP